MSNAIYRDHTRIASLRRAAKACRAAPTAKEGNAAYDRSLYRIEKLTSEFDSTRYILQTIDDQLDFPLYTPPSHTI